MARHLFLTGDKQVGKSTLIQRLLENEMQKIGGFYTVKTEMVFPKCSSVHLLQIGAGEEPSEENFLFRCDAPEDEMAAERFNKLGCAAVKASKDAKLIIMDELGPKETQAKEFQKAILQVMDGDVPILGVLQKADADFLKQIAAHPKVCVLEVTEKNRNDIDFWRDLMKGPAGIVKKCEGFMERLEVCVDDISKSKANAIVCVEKTILPEGADVVSNILKTAGVDSKAGMYGPGSVSFLTSEQFAAKNILCAAGPEWQGGNHQEQRDLAACYQGCLDLAEKKGFETVDILAVPAGVYDSRLFQVATTTLQAVRDFLSAHESIKKVRIICQDDKMVMVYMQAYNFWFADVKASRMQYEGWD